MLVLSIRTDKPEAEIGLYEAEDQLAYTTWHAHRDLSVTIHTKINELLHFQGQSLERLAGIVVFKGPGSFTGLRIGLSVANALAYGLGIPVISTKGKNWIATGLRRLQKGDNETVALPEYGSPVHITPPRK